MNIINRSENFPKTTELKSVTISSDLFAGVTGTSTTARRAKRLRMTDLWPATNSPTRWWSPSRDESRPCASRTSNTTSPVLGTRQKRKTRNHKSCGKIYIFKCYIEI